MKERLGREADDFRRWSFKMVTFIALVRMGVRCDTSAVPFPRKCRLEGRRFSYFPILLIQQNE